MVEVGAAPGELEPRTAVAVATASLVGVTSVGSPTGSVAVTVARGVGAACPLTSSVGWASKTNQITASSTLTQNSIAPGMTLRGFTGSDETSVGEPSTSGWLSG